VETWSQANASLTSPEQIIVAAVIESFAKDFESWTVNPYIVGNAHFAYASGCYEDHDYSRKFTAIRNDKAGITLKRRIREKYNYESSNKYYYEESYINDLELPDRLSQEILRAYRRVLVRVQAAKQAAETARLNMEKNEAAWQLAEKLLGMKRNEQGALVPVKTVEPEVAQAIEEECDCDLGEVCRVCG
jgi:hypothetical protein